MGQYTGCTSTSPNRTMPRLCFVLPRYHACTLRPFGLACALFAASASAHDTIPADWCPAGEAPIVVDTFAFSAPELSAYRRAQLDAVDADGKQTCPIKTCGIIDEWHWANEQASAFCGNAGLKSASEAIAFVLSPSDFNAADHHGQYGFNDGNLEGVCVVCKKTTIHEPSKSPANR